MTPIVNPPRALHRSLTFWAGLLVVAFISFAWWDSSSHISHLSRKNYWACNTLHGLYLNQVPHWKEPLQAARTARNPIADTPPYDATFHRPFFIRSYDSIKDSRPEEFHDLREAAQYEINLFGPGCWALYIPHWLILLPIVLTWTALLLWRAHRHRRAITPPAQRHSD